MPTEMPDQNRISAGSGRICGYQLARKWLLMTCRGLQWVRSLADFIFAAARLGLDIIGSRKTCGIGPLNSDGPRVIGYGRY